MIATLAIGFAAGAIAAGIVSWRANRPKRLGGFTLCSVADLPLAFPESYENTRHALQRGAQTVRL